MTEDILPVPPLPNPVDEFTQGKYRIAMIIDGVVHQVMYLEARDAAKYLSEPIFVQIPRSLHVQGGDLYDGNIFIPRN